MDYIKKGTLILTSLLEDLVVVKTKSRLVLSELFRWKGTPKQPVPFEACQTLFGMVIKASVTLDNGTCFPEQHAHGWSFDMAYPPTIYGFTRSTCHP